MSLKLNFDFDYFSDRKIFVTRKTLITFKLVVKIRFPLAICSISADPSKNESCQRSEDDKSREEPELSRGSTGVNMLGTNFLIDKNVGTMCKGHLK